jgi:aspartyl protease family protein
VIAIFQKFCRFLPLAALSLGGCGTFSSTSKNSSAAGNQVSVVTAPAETAPISVANVNATNLVRLMKEADGHFYAEVRINNMPVRFMVDTGASTIALSIADAEALGIEMSEGDFNEVGRGVGGEVPMKRVTLESVDLGGIRRTNVEAVVVNSDMPISLLGQSFLNSLGTLTIQGNEMTLRP